MTVKPRRVSKRWTQKTLEFFKKFLDETDFPDPERIGERGPKFLFPEWMIMFIAVLSVKFKIKTYVQIHKMVMDYWDKIAQDTGLEPISESQQHSFFKYFLNWSNDRVMSADKMMNRAKGPIWHKKQKDLGIMPNRLRGLDKEATWCTSHAPAFANAKTETNLQRAILPR